MFVPGHAAVMDRAHQADKVEQRVFIDDLPAVGKQFIKSPLLWFGSELHAAILAQGGRVKVWMLSG